MITRRKIEALAAIIGRAPITIAEEILLLELIPDLYALTAEPAPDTDTTPPAQAATTGPGWTAFTDTDTEATPPPPPSSMRDVRRPPDMETPPEPS